MIFVTNVLTLPRGLFAAPVALEFSRGCSTPLVESKKLPMQYSKGPRVLRPRPKYTPLTREFAETLFPLIDLLDWGFHDGESPKYRASNLRLQDSIAGK